MMVVWLAKSTVHGALPRFTVGNGTPVPNDEPVSVTRTPEGPVGPVLGARDSSDGAEYENESELEVCDETCTEIAMPVPWPAGMRNVTCVSDHDCTMHVLEPNVTVPLLDDPPRDTPVMVIVEPPTEGAEEGDTPDNVGGL